ncbi:conjugal transfer pilus assembly protein TraU [Hydrogenophilus thermoluteolus]|uniref:conjugal transfer pilus assembly protein TraU n=1 Tax=Hydrogenophilus thermoluteolus TaxID=297 RepID=UPI002553DE7C|nr:conjugal transfer pilus assembly protein TraU [Hydrogenophilus thermoluteolus]
MKSVRNLLLAFFVLLAGAQTTLAATCKGKFANPITDICWSCMFPLRIAGVTLASLDQEDTPNPGGAPVCFCGNPPKIGFKVSFWEPVRRVDVSREPFCMVSLGGVKLNPGFDAPEHGRTQQDDKNRSSFYQAHWYVDPIIFYLQAVLDNGCLENMGFDLAYLTELDPLWNDDELTRILNPDVYLFANFPAQAACAADCVAATAGFSNNLFFWCAGCNGSMYPLNGNVAAHVGGVQASSLVATRLIAKMHREGLMWAASGNDGLCGYYPQPLMDKTNYKYHMLYPIPQTKKIAGKCCQPFGRTTILWGAGREFPYAGEDFSYQVFRKRNCCQGAVGVK